MENTKKHHQPEAVKKIDTNGDVEHIKEEPLDADTNGGVEHIKEEPLESSDDPIVAEQGIDDPVVIKDEPGSSIPCNDCSTNTVDFEVPSEEGGGFISVKYTPCPDSFSRRATEYHCSKKNNKERQKIVSAFREKLLTSPSLKEDCHLETTQNGLLAVHSWNQRVRATRKKILGSVSTEHDRKFAKERIRGSSFQEQEVPSRDCFNNASLGSREKPSAFVKCFHIEGSDESSQKSTRKLSRQRRGSCELGLTLSSTVCHPLPSGSLGGFCANEPPVNPVDSSCEPSPNVKPGYTASSEKPSSRKTSKKTFETSFTKTSSSKKLKSNEPVIKTKAVRKSDGRNATMLKTKASMKNPATLVENDNDHSAFSKYSAESGTKRSANNKHMPKGNGKSLMTRSVKRSQRQSKKPRISFEELAVSGEELNSCDPAYESGNKKPPRKGESQKRKPGSEISRSHSSTERPYVQLTPKEVFWEYNPTTGVQKYRGIEVQPCSVIIPVMTKDFLANYGIDLGKTEGCKINIKTLKRGLFSCAHCRYRTNYKYVLARHMTKHAKENEQFKCPHCEYRGTRQAYVTEHVRSFHLKEKRFKCDQCDYSSTYWTGLRSHKITKHTISLSLSCPHCDYKTKHKNALILHLKIHTGERAFPCPHCPYRARQYPHLKSHIFVHLGMKPYACKECSYKTRQKSHLNQHMKLMHSDEKPLKCDYCDFKCKCSHTLILHKRRHTGERPFACSVCPFRTAHSVLINKHKKEHELKKSHQCPHCSWSSDSQLSIKNHVSQWHPEKCAYKCNMCEFASTVLDSLYYHKQRKHNILQTLRCPHCKFSCNRLYTYRRHVKSHEEK